MREMRQIYVKNLFIIADFRSRKSNKLLRIQSAVTFHVFVVTRDVPYICLHREYAIVTDIPYPNKYYTCPCCRAEIDLLLSQLLKWIIA